MKILVTGAAGFIGSNLTKALYERGHNILGIDDLSLGEEQFLRGFHIKNLTHNYTGTKLSITSNGFIDITKAFQPEVIVHLAAIPNVARSVDNPKLTFEINVGGTSNVLEAARIGKVKRVIFASSSSVYGGQTPGTIDLKPNPQSPYALHKLMGEQLLDIYHKVFNLETVSLRFFNVFGPHQTADSSYAAVIPAFIKAYLTKSEHIVYGTGEQTRDFCYVDNVTETINLALAHPSGVYNVGNGTQASLNDLEKVIQGFFPNNKSERVNEPKREGDVDASLADITFPNGLAGYNPKISVCEGLGKTIEWWKEISA